MRRTSVLAGMLGLLFSLTLALPPVCAEPVVYSSGNRRDPFVALPKDDGGSASVSPAGLKLEGIIYDPGSKSLAILNGKTYSIGETVGEAKIVSILKDQVVISVAGEEKKLLIRND